jgi:hexulose-6-phosphate isomerase
MSASKRPSRIGIMQGRLLPPAPNRFQSFPRTDWPEEFARAVDAGLDAIEWIYDAFGEDVNPLASDDGIARLRAHAAHHGIAVVSVCADYFMDRPFLRASEAERRDIVSRLYWIIERSRRAEFERIVLPFVDASRITNDEEVQAVVALLREVIPAAQRAGIELHLETALGPEPFAALLRELPQPTIWVNYDSGNSASLGYRPSDEFAAYGDRIGSVHIKDRRLGGSTVPLGTGSADLPAVFAGLRHLGYRRDYVLQAARGEVGLEVQRARDDREFVERGIRDAAASALTP